MSLLMHNKCIESFTSKVCLASFYTFHESLSFVILSTEAVIKALRKTELICGVTLLVIPIVIIAVIIVVSVKKF